jgi:hypothetical protein
MVLKGTEIVVHEQRAGAGTLEWPTCFYGGMESKGVERRVLKPRVIPEIKIR